MAKTKIPGEYLKDSVVRFTAKAGENITKGQSVYISGISGEVPVVSLADADDTNKMPAFGLAESTVSTNGSIEVTSNGTLAGIDTSSYALGDILYISTTAGSLTNDPSGLEASKVQNIGMVQRVHASNGSIKVGGAGRTNATPNLNDGKIFLGNGSNQSVSTTLDSSVVPENTNLYYTDARVQAVSINNVVEDTTPQLGGDLDLNSSDITGTGDINITGAINLGDTYGLQWGTGNERITGVNTGNSLRFITNNQERMRVNTTGIDVTGVITSDGLTLQTSENTVSWASGNGVIEAPSNLYLRSTGSGTIYLQDNIDVTGTATMDGLSVIGDTGFNTASPNAYAHIVPTDGELNDQFVGLRVSRSLSLKSAQYGTINQSNGALTLNSTVTTGSASGSVRLLSSADGSTTKTLANFHNNNDISFYEDTGATAKFFWDASAESLSITGNANVWTIDNTTIYGNRAGGSIYVGNSSATGEFGITSGGSVAMQFDTDGNVGIGTDSPVSATGYTVLTLNNATNGGNIVFQSNGTAKGYVYNSSSQFRIEAGASTPMVFANPNGEAMRIDSSKNLLVGKFNNALANDGVVVRGGGEILATNTSDLSANFNRLSTDGAIVAFYKDGSTVGSIGTEGTDLTIGSGGAGFQFLESENKIRPFNVSTNSASNGVVDLGRANANFKDLYLSGAIKMDSDFDDYEEGTWTPTGALTQTLYSATYTKIGRVVTIQVHLLFDTSANVSLAANITGLPFTASNITGMASPLTVWVSDDGGNTNYDIQAAVLQNESRIRLSAAGGVLKRYTEISNGYYIIGGSYFTDS